MKAITTILAAVDFSENSDYAFDLALLLAKKFRAKLVVLHVIDNSYDMSGFYIPHPSIEQMFAEFEESAKGMMAEFCKERLSGFASYSTAIVNGVPYREILSTAEECAASLIVLGTHGRSGLERLVFGSTAERVVRRSTCPVLTIPLP